MTAYTAAAQWNGLPDSETMWGGLGGGYFAVVTSDGDPRVTTWRLRHFDAPSTDVDTLPLGTYPDDLFTIAPSRDSEIWYARSDFPRTYQQLTRLTRSGTTLVLDEIGAPTSTTTAWSDARRTFDGSAFFYKTGTTTQAARSTADASLLWTWSKSTLTGHNWWHCVPMDANRVLGMCYTHDVWELWDASTDTLLDSLTSLDARWNGYEGSWTAVGADRAFFAWNADDATDTVDIGVVDTTGDVLSLTWSTEGYATGWGEPLAPSVGSVGSLAVVHTRTVTDPAAAVSLFLVDTATGDVSASTPDIAASYGSSSNGVESHSLAFTGATRLVVGGVVTFPATDDRKTGWGVAPVSTRPRYLRQRQSPRQSIRIGVT